MTHEIASPWAGDHRSDTMVATLARLCALALAGDVEAPKAFSDRAVGPIGLGKAGLVDLRHPRDATLASLGEDVT